MFSAWIRCGVLIALALLSGPLSADTYSYSNGGLERIVRSHRNQAFLLVLWSLDCGACMKELTALGQLQQSHPSFRLVLVSIDDPGRVAEVNQALAVRGLAQAESWIFAEEGDNQMLRYEIDPTWYGEIPRSYFYDARHYREGVSGVPDKARLDHWAHQS